MFLHYQHDGFNIFSSLILRWVLLLNFCRWVKLSNELLLYGIDSFCPDLAILAVSTQEIFLPLPLLLSSTGISSTSCNFIYRDDIVLNLTISPEYFLYFQKAKTDKAMSRNDTRSIFKPLSLFFILLVPFILD